MTKSPYKTKQAEEILHYFLKHPSKHIHVQEIYDAFQEEGKKIGLATIYRQVEKLVQQGKLFKYVLDRENGACYEMAHSHEEECHNDFHFKCEGCGKLLHLHCHEVEHFNQHLYQDHGFRINKQRLVFYGLCQDCNKRDIIKEEIR